MQTDPDRGVTGGAGRGKEGLVRLVALPGCVWGWGLGAGTGWAHRPSACSSQWPHRGGAGAAGQEGRRQQG